MDELLHRLEPRTLAIGMTSLVLLLAAMLFSYVLMPEIKAYRQAATDRTALERALGSSVAVHKQLTDLSAEVEHLSRELHGDMANLPDKQLEAFVIGRLQGISWRNQVELVSVRPGKGEAVQIFRESLFDVEIMGDYFDLFVWLQNLTEELGFVVVKRFVIRPVNSDSQTPRLSARLTIVSYRKA